MKKNVLLGHNYVDLESLKNLCFFLLYAFNLSLLLSPYGEINDSTNFLFKEIYFAEQKN